MEIDGKKIVKIKTIDKSNNTMAYLIFVPYPERYGLKSPILVSYSFSNESIDESTIEEFDRVIASVEFE